MWELLGNKVATLYLHLTRSHLRWLVEFYTMVSSKDD